mmetsp:Transcript_24071/g.62016  ORF Transcript_24071/g.62016 Transcript_24071/m.62016 type:complete len:819 (+) Transcript_24071:46-2502(+)
MWPRFRKEVLPDVERPASLDHPDAILADGVDSRLGLSHDRPVDLEQHADSILPKVDPPVYTRGYEFADAELEAQYRRDEVQHVLETRAQYVGAALGLATLAWGMLDAVLAQGVNLYYYYFVIWYTFLWCGLGAFAHVAAKRSWPLQRTELTLCLSYVATCFSCFLLLLGGANVQLFEVRTIVAVVLTSKPGIMMQVMCFLALFAVYTPIRPKLYSVMALAAWGAFLLNEVILYGRLFSRVEPLSVAEWEWFVESIAYLCLFGTFTVIMIVVNALISKIHHSAYHFLRSVRIAVAERYRLARREAEKELQLKTAEAAKAARSRLIRMVMHDLRSPLLSVSNAASLLGEVQTGTGTLLSDAEGAECVRSLSTCSELMQHIVSDMLDFERIDSGRLVLVRKPFPVSALLEAATHTFKGMADSKEVKLRTELIASPGGAHGALGLVGDVRRLQQCLNNGISNALKFTDAGGEVTVSAWREHGSQDGVDTELATAAPDAAASRSPPAPLATWVLEVRDTGVGLSADDQAKLNGSDAFTQVGLGQMQGRGGTGLGITITRDLLRLHGDGCTLQLISDGPGTGTRFRIRLRLPEQPLDDTHTRLANGPHTQPVAARPRHAPRDHRPQMADRPSASTLSGEWAAGRSSTGSRNTSGAFSSPGTMVRRPLPPLAASGAVAASGCRFPPDFRLLHVEDDAVLRRTIELRLFKKLNVPFDVAVDGLEALRLILDERRHYTVLLMDNQMPRMTGTKATLALRENGFEGIIIGMTGDPAGCAERDEFEAAGLNAIVDKDTAAVKYISSVLLSFCTAASSAAPAAAGADYAV